MARSLQTFFLIASVLFIVFYFVLRSSDGVQVNSSTGLLTPPISLGSSNEPSYIVAEKGNISYQEAEENVFKPLGYTIEEKTVIPKLNFLNAIQCSTIFEQWLSGSLSQNESEVPPRDIPRNLLKQYTMNGYAGLIMGYMDDRSGVHEAKWEKQIVDEYTSKSLMDVDNYAGEGRAMYHAMKAYDIRGKSGFIIGSLSPWVEAFAIRLGAAKIKTLEYMKITTPPEYPWMSYSHPIEIAKDYQNHIEAYDFASSFSSIEHSGLGRFGDALDPIGDIKESLKVHCMLKEGGLFFLGIPVGRDVVYWNLHRNYGRIRLAFMAAGFDVVDMFLKDERVLITPQFFLEKHGSQPVIVLRKRYSSNIATNQR